jgi:hypothetical protein
MTHAKPTGGWMTWMDDDQHGGHRWMIDRLAMDRRVLFSTQQLLDTPLIANNSIQLPPNQVYPGILTCTEVMRVMRMVKIQGLMVQMVERRDAGQA